MKRIYGFVFLSLTLMLGKVIFLGMTKDSRFIGEIDFITAEVGEMIIGKSWKVECPVAFEDLRYLQLSYWDYEGKVLLGELIVHKNVAKDVVDIFRELFENEFPIERMKFIDWYDCNDERSMRDNNTSAFCYRQVDGSDRLSHHSYGIAIDINPLVNPCVVGNLVSPVGSENYVDRTKDVKGMITEDSVCYKAFAKKGWRWGGHWVDKKDYQHFSLLARCDCYSPEVVTIQK